MRRWASYELLSGSIFGVSPLVLSGGCGQKWYAFILSLTTWNPPRDIALAVGAVGFSFLSVIEDTGPVIYFTFSSAQNSFSGIILNKLIVRTNKTEEW